MDPLSFITNVQRQYSSSLCFATPVRVASTENVANLSDWMLTAEEFAARYKFDREGKCGGYIVPDVDESSASQSLREEDETITSASYFEQKFSHLIETTPPMLLFDVHRVAVSERDMGAILTLANDRQRAYEAKRNSTNGEKSRNKTPVSSPSDRAVAAMTETPRKMTGSLSKRSKKCTSPTKDGISRKEYDLAPIGMSSSVSSTSQESEQDDRRRCQRPQRIFREPDIVHFTLCE
ncbi:hypothetical protein ACHAXA_005865 [Cyclostephanos tholiformis]|uniref:Uncharacterized protein n=1 Tax=Cyclostephanos tholiformis TaxID=382380 RepID=A0ABD3RCY0_9STRA